MISDYDQEALGVLQEAASSYPSYTELKDTQGLHMDEFLVLLKIGDVVELLPEHQDPGDSEFEWVVVEPEDRGRLVISPLGTGLKLVPKYAVERAWVRPKANSA